MTMTPTMTALIASFSSQHSLTHREREVLAILVSEGSPAKIIADRLQLSHHTVNNHFKNLFSRTGTGTRAELLALFVRHLLTIEKHPCLPHPPQPGQAPVVPDAHAVVVQ